jgi:hypothetical protein
VGIVVIANAVIATAPTLSTARAVQQALGTLPVAPASRRVARTLGFRELGSQVSIRIAHP